MKNIIIALLTFVAFESTAQVVFEGNLTVHAKNEKSYDFPAEEKDELYIAFKKIEGKKISKIELRNEADEVVYMYYDLKSLKKKVFIKEAGRYKLTFINDEKKDFNGNFTVTLTAKDKKKRKISHKRVIDTTYGYAITQKVKLVSTKYV